jgi:hypothetical protein
MVLAARRSNWRALTEAGVRLRGLGVRDAAAQAGMNLAVRIWTRTCRRSSRPGGTSISRVRATSSARRRCCEPLAQQLTGLLLQDAGGVLRVNRWAHVGSLPEGIIEVGQTVGNYTLTAKLGEGGMGTVFLAEHPVIGSKVALKAIHPQFARNGKPLVS